MLRGVLAHNPNMQPRLGLCSKISVLKKQGCINDTNNFNLVVAHIHLPKVVVGRYSSL